MAGTLHDHAVDIWKAGVAAVDSERLTVGTIHCSESQLSIAEFSCDPSRIGEVLVIGAGKAGAGMAAGVERAFENSPLADRYSGLLNVPAGCVRKLARIDLHAARPDGLNEPTEEGVQGSREMLARVRRLGADDLCLILLSGGGSALLPAPAEGISLADKQLITKQLMAAGAPIQDLNRVRKKLSSIKGGKLAEALAGITTVVLVISDVIGDPLDIIASGPTVPDRTSRMQALEILQSYVSEAQIPASVLTLLRSPEKRAGSDYPNVHHFIVGSNATAVRAASTRAKELGYQPLSLGSENTGIAREVGAGLARRAMELRAESKSKPVCLIHGGEPTVRLSQTQRPGRGGRNQELVLGAVREFLDVDMDGIAILSGGTDGEDGPTDAAGALATQETIDLVRSKHISIDAYLDANNSYVLLDQVGALLKTGPTHTNVMDLAVVLIR